MKPSLEKEPRLRKEEMEEQFNNEANEGWTSGGVFVAVDSNLGAVIGTEEGLWSQFQATREESPKHELMCKEVCVSPR